MTEFCAKTKFGWKPKSPSRSLQSTSWQFFAPSARCIQTSSWWFYGEANTGQLNRQQNCFPNLKNGMLLKSIAFTRIAEVDCESLETERPVFKMPRLNSNNVQKPFQFIYSSWLLTSNKQIMFNSPLTKCSLHYLLFNLTQKPESSHRK